MLLYLFIITLSGSSAIAKNGWMYSKNDCKAVDKSNTEGKEWSPPFNLKNSGCLPHEFTNNKDPGGDRRTALWLPPGDDIGCWWMYNEYGCEGKPVLVQTKMKSDTDTCWTYMRDTRLQAYKSTQYTKGACDPWKYYDYDGFEGTWIVPTDVQE